MRRIAYLTALLLALAGAEARGDDIEVPQASLVAVDEGLVLNADFEFELNARLEEVVANGVPLYFRVEFEMTRPRWYWFDERAVSRVLQLRLSYHALSRQYRLSAGLLQQNFSSLEEALNVLKRVRNWLVADRTITFSDADYEAAVRMRLDAAMLPRPFQLSALTSRELQLESPWRRFSVRPQQVPAPVESRQPKGGEK
ncbi:MAG TPA: DUF4390 domain-containing protein [Burkholderiales bacterium]